ncbi:MAG: hypothetical protein LBK66_07145 [Spirochaetaceae bacterium]|nr:hypothetical protein [Spirochaetaceae bacterium]
MKKSFAGNGVQHEKPIIILPRNESVISKHNRCAQIGRHRKTLRKSALIQIPVRKRTGRGIYLQSALRPAAYGKSHRVLTQRITSLLAGIGIDKQNAVSKTEQKICSARGISAV